ncbi:hypothetical protein [Actinoallomurus sp. CA-150999]|uniref:hypothetical protein n=1 Tax=Actinoallomurus sp. CA-150999 TaxID=3239887 RepID=UPI003D921EC9
MRARAEASPAAGVVRHADEEIVSLRFGAEELIVLELDDGMVPVPTVIQALDSVRQPARKAALPHSTIPGPHVVPHGGGFSDAWRRAARPREGRREVDDDVVLDAFQDGGLFGLRQGRCQMPCPGI